MLPVTMAMNGSDAKITEFQFIILDGLVDLYEDVEHVYLYANRDFTEENRTDVKFPHMLVQVRFALRDIVDEIGNMLREGYIEAKYSNDEEAVPLRPLDFTALHHYWFGLTRKGMEARKAYLRDEPASG